MMATFAFIELVSTVAKCGSSKGTQSEKKITDLINLLTLKPFSKLLSDKLSGLKSNSYGQFEKSFLTVLNKQAPFKNSPFVIKELRRAIIK